MMEILQVWIARKEAETDPKGRILDARAAKARGRSATFGARSRRGHRTASPAVRRSGHLRFTPTVLWRRERAPNMTQALWGGDGRAAIRGQVSDGRGWGC